MASLVIKTGILLVLIYASTSSEVQGGALAALIIKEYGDFSCS